MTTGTALAVDWGAIGTAITLVGTAVTIWQSRVARTNADAAKENADAAKEAAKQAKIGNQLQVRAQHGDADQFFVEQDGDSAFVVGNPTKEDALNVIIECGGIQNDSVYIGVLRPTETKKIRLKRTAHYLDSVSVRWNFDRDGNRKMSRYVPSYDIWDHIEEL